MDYSYLLFVELQEPEQICVCLWVHAYTCVYVSMSVCVCMCVMYAQVYYNHQNTIRINQSGLEESY